MATNKYIGTKDVVRLTGLSMNEVYNLIHDGTLPARKAPKSGWRISYQVLEEQGLIQEKPNHVIEESQAKDCIYFVTDEDHYTKVFKKMTEVGQSLKIATADLKNFNVYIESDGKSIPLRLCDFFHTLVKRGIHVQVVCMDPFGFYNYTKDNCPNLLDNPLFELRHNKHCHMKIFIFDDECAYIGSANITRAAIGRKGSNHEAGMLLSGDMIEAPLHHFDKVWEDPCIIKHTWKRFIKIAKETEKRRKAKYDN